MLKCLKNHTHTSSLDSSTMFDRAFIWSILATLILKGVFISGSSKHGNTRLALLGDIFFAANHLKFKENYKLEYLQFLN